MSHQRRPVETNVIVCDLCKKVISDALEPAQIGSLTQGYIAHDVRPQTKHAWLIWPRRRPGHPVLERRYDFHADCIGRLVESAAGAGELA